MIMVYCAAKDFAETLTLTLNPSPNLVPVDREEVLEQREPVRGDLSPLVGDGGPEPAEGVVEPQSETVPDVVSGGDELSRQLHLRVRVRVRARLG